MNSCTVEDVGENITVKFMRLALNERSTSQIIFDEVPEFRNLLTANVAESEGKAVSSWR